MSAQVGYNALLCYGADSENVTALRNVRDVTVALENEGSDITPNVNGGWRVLSPALRDATIDWLMLWDIADVGLQAIRDAYLQDTPIWILAFDGAADDPEHAPEGLLCKCVITTFKIDERATSAISVRVSAKPTLATEEPAWVQGLLDIDNGQFVYDDTTGDLVLVAA